LPVRAAYNDKEADRLNIGLNYLTSEEPIWVAGPDVVSSVLLTGGKVPRILTNSKEVLADNSGHYVMVDRPDLVISAIRDVVESARHHTKLNH
jgi:hypothetical protein